MQEKIEGLNFNGIKKLFNIQQTKTSIFKAETDGNIPVAHRQRIGESSRTQRIWDYSQITKIGERYGFLKKFKEAKTVSIFATKGGILKSTIALNTARLHALHNIKTIVVDLDPQADSSTNLGVEIPEDDLDDLEKLDELLEGIPGLYDVKTGEASIEEVIQGTDIPTLDVISANSDLIHMTDVLNAEVRREYWLKDKVVSPLQELGYELIIFDLAPSWSIYTSNALAASDLLISPLECKVNHYRNAHRFIAQLDNFLKKMDLGEKLETIFVPVKASSARKLSTQIKQYYHAKIKNCASVSIRESVTGEEAVAQKLSVIEYAHNKVLAEDIRELMMEINTKLCSTAKKYKLQ